MLVENDTMCDVPATNTNSSFYNISMKNKNLIKNFTLPKHNTNNCRSTKKLFTKLEFRHPRDNTNGETNAVNNRKTNKKARAFGDHSNAE